MKNSIFNAVCKTRYLALLVVLIFTCGNVWGTETTFTVTVETGSTTMSKGDISVSTTSGTFSRTDNYRVYANNSMTISSSGGNITQVVFSVSQNTFTADVGTWTDGTKTWTGDASSITFSASGGQVRFTTFTVTYGSGSTPTLTTSSSMTTLTYSAGSPVAQSFTIGGSNLTNDVTVTAPTNYEVCKTANGTYTSSVSFTNTEVNAADKTVYIRLQSGLSAGNIASSNITVASSGADSKTIAVTGSVPYTITWMANGSTFETTYVAVGSTLALPASDPNPSTYSCTGKSFYGWYGAGSSYSHASTAPTIAAAGNAVSADKTYYAVFGTLTGGGASGWSLCSTADDVTAGTYVITWDNSYYLPSETTASSNPAVGSGITVSNNKLSNTVTSAMQWTFTGDNTNGFAISHVSGNNTYKLSATNAAQGISVTTGSTDRKWTVSVDGTYGMLLNGDDGGTRNLAVYNSGSWRYYSTGASYTGTLRLYKYSSGGTWSDYATTCCTPLGTINGSVSLTQLASPDPTKLKATWTMNASTGIASYDLEVYNSSDVKVKTIEGYTSGDEITGLDPCTTYYVKLYTVSSGSPYCAGGLISTSSTCTTNGYTLTVSKTNVTLDSGSEPSNICSNVSATYIADANYDLPTSITVTNAGAENTGWTWNSSTGVLTINKANVTGNVTVTITGVAQSTSYRLWTGWGNSGDLSQGGNTWDWVGGAYFVQVGSSNEWQITNYTIPNHVWTGSAQMVYNVEGKNPTNTKFYDLAFAVSQGTSNIKKGPMPGAVGTLRMYDNSDQPNGYLGFLPNNYMVRFGTHDYIMTETSSTVWETAIQTLDAADLTNVSQYRVGVTNSSDEFVAINENCPLTNVTTMGQKSNAGNNWGSNLAAGDAGKRGKFRIWLDNATNNWTCHFVPYHRIIFDANWPVGAIGDEPADTYSVDVSVEETNSSIALASAPTAPAGYTFDGWYTAADGGTKRTGSQTISAGATADVTLSAHWTANTNTAYTVRHYQQNIANDDYTLFATQNLEGTTGTSVTPATNSYTGFTAPSTVTQTILGDGSLVINYYYTRNSYTLTWVLNGGTVTTAGTCAAVNATGSPSGSVKYGASLTAPIVAKTGYNMTWSSSPAATMPATNTTYTANWTLKTTTVSFNQNEGTGGQSSTKTATYGSAMPTPITTPTKAGYTFTGYYENSGGTGTKYYNEDGTSATEWDKENSTWTLYAGWTAKEDTYKTALHTSAAGWTTYASGVTKSGGGYTIPNPGSVTKGATSTCEDTHYYFAGWVADEYKGSPSGHIISATGTTDATGTTYWAVWEKETSGGATTIELNYSNLSVSTSSYAQSSATVGGVGFTINQGYRGGSNPNYLIQMNSSKGDGTLFNTTAISGLQSIKLYCATAGATATIYQGTSQKPVSTSDPDERIGTAACAASTNYTINFTGSGEYFTLKVGGATYFSKIEVSYCTYEDPKAECEACVATPTISGVSLTSGTYSLTSVPVQATGASAGENCAIASYGFCWGTSANPTGNSTASANLSAGTFSATLTGPFEVGTPYYYRAFATNEAPNTGYSSDGTFTLRSVTFNLNGHGSSAPSTQYVNNGGKASDPSYSESVTNWRFVGWYDEAACRDGHEWVFGTNTVSGANATIYAKWLPDPTITFSVPTGVDAVASQRASVNLPTPTGFPSAVDDDCWAFAGWTESNSVNSTSKPATFYPAGTPYTGSQTSPFTLYAVYSRNKYLVVYDNDMLVADADYVITTWESDNYAVVGVADGNNAEVADMEDNFHDKVLRGLHYYTLDNPAENAVWHMTGTTDNYVLQNKATGKFLDLSSTSSPMISGSSATVAVTEGTGEDAQTYKLTSGDNHLVISSSGASVATGDATYYFLYKLLSSKYMTTPAEPTFTVTWKVAGEDDQTSTVSACAGIQASDISALTIPGDDHLEIKNGGCITNTKGKFMGWSTHDYGSASGKGSSDFSDLFKTYDKAPYLTDDITLYAVFAEAGGGGVPYYGLVEEDEDATEGTYLIVYNGTYAMGSHHDGNNADTYSDYSNISSYYDDENKKIASNSTTNALAYIAEETTNGYSLKHSETISSVATDVYLGCSKNDNKALRWDYPFTASTDEWLLGAGTVNSVAQSSRYIRWNNTSGQYRFSTYQIASCQDIQLYKYNSGVTYSDYRTSCCAKKVTIGTPTKTGTGTGTVTFESGGDAYAAGDEVETCAGATTITATVTPGLGHQCTALSFTRSDAAALTPDPAISVPFTSAQSYDLTFEQNADGVTLNTTVTFVALIDHYIDNMHYNTTQNKSGNYGTAPSLDDKTKGEQCTGLHYRFIGWIPEGDMNTTTGVPNTTEHIVTGGQTGMYATGTTYYAIWAEEE